jgi:hypothetical protein
MTASEVDMGTGRGYTTAMRRMPTNCLLAAGLCALAGCAGSPAAPPPSTSAVRYRTEVMEGTSFADITELYLPAQRMACNVSYELKSNKGTLETEHVAHAFFTKEARNRDRNAMERPTERCELPPALIDRLMELAELTARQHKLAAQVGAELVAAVPLDGLHEQECLQREMALARTAPVDQEKLDELERRAKAAGEDPQRLRDIRKDLAALVSTGTRRR